ncbi:MAG: HpaA family protein [Deltaproteobacteria bacterium]|nr:HpaA family protein [Deltaproteobacteria bacterium]
MKQKLSRYTAHIIVFTCILTILCFVIVACMTYQPMPASPATYKFSGYTTPETRRPASVRFTVAIVEPAYKEAITKTYSRVVKSFSSSIGSGLDQILVAKGMTTKGPYGSLDELPYPDKKNSNLTLTETVFIQTVEQADANAPRYGQPNTYYTNSQGKNVLCEVQSGKLTAEVWLTFELREPLSAEKMWIKRLDLGTLERSYKVGVEKYQYQDPSNPWVTQWRYGEEQFNTKPDALASILNEVYPNIMKSAWVYLDTEELLKLNEKVKEIRQLKRY